MRIAYNPKTAAALSQAPANNDITFDLSGLSIYVRGIRFKGTDTTYSVFKKHDENGGGYDGLVPVPDYNNGLFNRFLREDGTWQYIAGSSDINVYQSEDDTSDFRPVILGLTHSANLTELVDPVTGLVYVTAKIYACPSTGVLYATKLFSNGKEVLTEHQSLEDYVTLSTPQTIIGRKTFYTLVDISNGDKNADDSLYKRPIIYMDASKNMIYSDTKAHTIIRGSAIRLQTSNEVDTVNILPDTVKTIAKIVSDSTIQGTLLISTIEDISPLVVNSATLVAKLNSDLLDGYHVSGLFEKLENNGNELSLTIGGTEKNLIVNYATNSGKLGHSIKFKDITYQDVVFDGSLDIDLTSGIYHSDNSDLLLSHDTRFVNNTPRLFNSGARFEFKTNTTDGLNDGETYHGILHFRPYGYENDFTGGLTHLLGFTDNGNLYIRTSANSSTWGGWKKILHSSNTYVSGGNGYINNSEITQVNNSDTVDGLHGYDFTRTKYDFCSTSDNSMTSCTDFATWVSRLSSRSGILGTSSITTGAWWWVRSIDLQVNGWNIQTAGAMVIHSGNGNTSNKNYKHFLILDAYSELYGITSNEESWKTYARFLNSNNYTSYVNPRATSKTIWGLTYIDASGNFLNVNGLLYVTANGNTTTIGSLNGSWCHIYNSANVPFIFNKSVFTIGNVCPYGNNTYQLGDSSNKWKHLYLSNRAYLDEWILFSSATGLYWPNTNGAHLYANTTTSYGALITLGSRGGYCGLHCGPNNTYMTVMSHVDHLGLYNESRGRWSIYYNRPNDRIGIYDSNTDLGYGVQINQRTGIRINSYPSLHLVRTDAGETSMYFSNNTAGWAIGVNPWGVGAGLFAIGLYSGTGGSYWRFRIDNYGYCYTRSYLYLGEGNEKNASNPPYVWGVNGSDNYLRTYATSSLSVGYSTYSSYLTARYSNCGERGASLLYLWYDWNNTGSLGTYFHGLWCGSPDGNIGYQLAYLHLERNRLWMRTWDYGTWNPWYALRTSADTYVSTYGVIGGAEIPCIRHLLINGVTWWSNWYWSGLGGQPTWLWGSNDGVNMYVWNPSNFSVNSAAVLRGNASNPNNSHPGHGAKVFYSWNTGLANNDTSGYSNGITIGSHPYDTAYGFQIVQNMWDDRTYTRRYNGGWQSWKTLAWTSDIPTVTNYYWANIRVSASSNTGTSPTFSTCYTSNWFRSTGLTGWYSESYGGGIWMVDNAYVRTYGSKSFYVDNTGLHAIYTAGSFASAKSGGFLSVYSNGSWYYDCLYNHNNGNMSIDAPGGSLFISYFRGYTYFGGGTYYINRNGYFNGSVNYASSAGTASKLSTNAGSSANPVYFSGGVPVACSYSFKGLSTQPVVLVSGYFYRNYLNLNTWYFTGYKHSEIGSPSFSVNGGVMTLTFSNTVNVYFISACALSRLNFSGSGKISTTLSASNTEYSWRSEGAYWFNTYVSNSSKTSYLYIRSFRLADRNNDSWGSYASSWKLEEDAIHSVSFTIFGYI